MWLAIVPYSGFYHVGLTMGLAVGYWLRYRLLWFGSSGGSFL